MQDDRFIQTPARVKLLKVLISLRAKESEDKWLRNGLRLVTLVTVSGALLLTTAYLDALIGGSVSGGTRLVLFAYLLFAIVTMPLALVCLSVGLLRRYLLNQ